MAIPDLEKAVKEFQNDSAKREILVKALSIGLGGPLSFNLVTRIPNPDLIEGLRDLPALAEEVIKHLEDRVTV